MRTVANTGGELMRDYRRHHHYNEPSGGGLVLFVLTIGGALLGGLVLPMVVEIAPGRAGFAGLLAGFIIWLLILAANR
jgi:hypothetical protein